MNTYNCSYLLIDLLSFPVPQRIDDNIFFVLVGAVNITYEVIRGSLQNLSEVEGALAVPGQDFVSGTGSVVLQEGQTSVPIPVTILEVRTRCLPIPFV